MTTTTKSKGMIDPEHIGLPDEAVMACEDGLVENHYYQDLRWMDWGDYEVICDHEQELLDYEEEGGDISSDEAMFEFENNECYTLSLDPGVASTVAALAAAGACPITSCRGGPGHYEDHPLVLCWLPEDLLPAVEEAASGSGVRLTGTGGAVLIWTAGDVDEMMAFAEQLFDLCA